MDYKEIIVEKSLKCLHVDSISTEYLTFFKNVFVGLKDVLLSQLLWTVLVFSLLILVAFPATIKLVNMKWTAKINQDPFVSYVSDGASLALGGKIYLTNHPGTRIHEYFAWITKNNTFRRILWMITFENQSDLHTIVINADNGPENSSHFKPC
ncbi:MAG: hypothetical protein K9L30_18770 [Desulfobacterales bacterium]|nr:hypothetical protein [Desulfobacterales bacterium]